MVSYRIAKDSDDDDFISPTRFDVLDIVIGEFTFAASIEVKCKTLKCAFDHFLDAYKLARANNAIPNSIAVWCDSFFALDFPEYYDGLDLESIFVGYEHIVGHPDKWIYNFEFDDNEDSFFINFALNYAVAGIVKDFPTVYHPFPPTIDLFDDLDKSVPSAIVKEAPPMENLIPDTLNAESAVAEVDTAAVAKIDTATVPAEQPTPTLDQLTVEVKFYLKQTAQNILEVGKRLIQAKALLPHGEFGNWLKNNFGLSHNAANKFMKCAERFSNCSTSNILNQSQMFELLALPEDETEAFIEAQAAAGTPVEDMTVKKLRAEIADWKRRDEENQQKIAVYAEELSATQIELADTKDAVKKAAADANEKFTRYENAVRTVSDENYGLKRDLAAAQQDAQHARLELQNRPIEVVPPSDYHDVKNALAAKDAEIARKAERIASLQEQLKGTTDELNAKHAVELQALDAEDYATVAQKLDAIYALITDISNSPNAGKVIADYERNNPERYHLLCASFSDFIRIMEME